MKNFSLSESLFFFLGSLMVSASFLYFSYGFSITKSLIKPSSDPFQASYSVPIVESKGNEKPFIQLLFPAQDAVLTQVGNLKRGYSLKFKFEVYPHDQKPKFELYFRQKLIIEKELKLNGSGIYEVPVLIRMPGLYEWQIRSPKLTSEMHALTIHE